MIRVMKRSQLKFLVVKLDYFKLVVLSLTKKNNKYFALQGLLLALSS